MEPCNFSNITLERRAPGCYVPLTPVQCHAWNDLSKSAKGAMRMDAASARIFGPLSIGLLQKSIDAVVRRHESLRSRIVLDGGVPRPEIDEAYECNLEVVDVSGLSPQDSDATAQFLSRDFVGVRYDLSAGPPVAAKVLRLSEHEHVLLMAIDHTFMDAASCGIVRREIWTLYNQGVKGSPFSIPELQLEFSDYAVWLQHTHDAWLAEHEPYWRRRLLGATYELPSDDRLLGVADPRWERPIIPLGAALSGRLREISWHERTPLAMAVLTVLVAMVWRWFNQDDFVVRIAYHGRCGQSKLRNMVGFLAHSLHLRIRVPAISSFIELLRLVNLEFLSACEHQDYHRVPDFIPEIKTVLDFNWIGTYWSEWPAPNGEAVGLLKIHPFPIPLLWEVDANVTLRSLSALVWAGNFDFSNGEGINIEMPYMTHVFASDTMDRVKTHLPRFAGELVQRPLSPITAAVFRD